jgi:hypothetical protein
MPKIIGKSPPSSFDLEFIKNFNEFDFDSLFPNFKVFILSFRKNILYSWRNRVNRYSPIKRSKLKDLSFFSLLRGFTDENLHYVSLNLHTLYQGLEGFVYDLNSARFIADVLMPEFFIFVCISTFNISYSQVERYLHFLGYYGTFTS